MSEPIPGVRYYFDSLATEFKAPSRPSLSLDPQAEANFRPVQLSASTTDAELRTLFNVPAGANLVRWTFGNSDLETVFATQLGDNDILVLPERAEPYVIDTSKGFMAAGVAAVDAVGSDGKKDGTRSPIVANPRLWFEMCRARRGIIGLGPGAVVAPNVTAWSQGRQPVLENEPDGTQFQRAYFADGSTMNLVGAQETLMGFTHGSPIFANFTMRGRSLGGVSYSGLKRTGGTGVHFTLKRVHFDGSWRAHAGVPNGECGGVTLQGGTYEIEHCDFAPVDGGSPIMWNNNVGGTVKSVRSTRPIVGMWTFWRCGGMNTFVDVFLESRQTGINIEENRAGFELDWTNGTFSLDYSGNKFHFAINPVGGPPKITLRNVTPSRNAYTSNALTANVYSTPGIARRSMISCDTLPVSCVPSSYWIS